MKTFIRILLTVAFTMGLISIQDTSLKSDTYSTEQKIKLHFEEETLTATLNNSKAAQDFQSLLPLTLTLEDYAQTEKVSDLPRSLSTEGSPSGSEASAGDIAHYAPWGNLAIFYKDFRYTEGLIILGSIDGDVEALKGSASRTVTIELMD